MGAAVRAALARSGARLAAVVVALGAILAPGTASAAAVGWCNELAQSIEAPLVVFQVHGGEVRSAPCQPGAGDATLGAPPERPAPPNLAAASPDRLMPAEPPLVVARAPFALLSFPPVLGPATAAHAHGVFRPPRA